MKCSILKKTVFVLPLVVGALSGPPASAQPAMNVTDQVPAVAIETLVKEALQKNPELKLKFYEAEIAAARAGRRTAGQFANPELSGSVGQKSASNAGLRSEGLAWSASLMQPFEWPGRMGLRKAIANRDIELAELGYERFKAALTAKVRAAGRTYFGAQAKRL